MRESDQIGIEIENAMRASGRSFRIAMKVCLAASYHPGKWMDVKDHHPTHGATEHLMRGISAVLEAWGVNYEVRDEQIRIISNGR